MSRSKSRGLISVAAILMLSLTFALVACGSEETKKRPGATPEVSREIGGIRIYTVVRGDGQTCELAARTYDTRVMTLLGCWSER